MCLEVWREAVEQQTRQLLECRQAGRALTARRHLAIHRQPGSLHQIPDVRILMARSLTRNAVVLVLSWLGRVGSGGHVVRMLQSTRMQLQMQMPARNASF